MNTLAIRVIVTETSPLAEGVLSLTLRRADALAMPAWAPGAHIDVVLAPDMIRQYSLCGDPTDLGFYRIAVLDEPAGRGGSRHIHRVLRPGDRLDIRGPRNNFPLLPATRYRFIAGGIGITPVLPMIDAVARGEAGWRLLYGGRRRASMAFLDRLREHDGLVDIVPEDERGRPDLASWLGAVEPGTRVYCCGPEGLLNAVARLSLDWPDGTLRLERFGVAEPGALSGGRAFDIVCARSGRVVRVAPGVSILDSLEAAGLDLPYSCREGICGACETQVLDGVPDHRDAVLSAAERAANRTIIPCRSRALSDRLVLAC